MEEARLKVTPCLLGLAVCAVFSTSPVMARHHAHSLRHASAGKSHTLSPTKPNAGGDANNLDRKVTSSGTAGNSEANRLRESDATGKRDFGKTGAAETDVDVRIAVHQGREKRKSVQEQLFKKKSKIAIGAELNRQRPNHVWQSAHRNAIGALVVHERELSRETAVPVPAEPGAGVNKSLSNAQPVIDGQVSAPKSAVVGNPAATPVTAAKPVDTGGAPHIAAGEGSPMNVSGTGLNRPTFSTAAISGSPKILAGSISGNSVHLRRP
jgi:hypothetical protein